MMVKKINKQMSTRKINQPFRTFFYDKKKIQEPEPAGNAGLIHTHRQTQTQLNIKSKDTLLFKDVTWLMKCWNVKIYFR